MEAFYLEERFGLAPHVAVIEGDHKYIDVPEAEVYDLSSDPGEENSLAADDPARVAALKGALDAFGFPAPGDREALPTDMAQELMALGYVEPMANIQIDGSRDAKQHSRLLGLSQRALQQRRRGDSEAAVETLETLIAEYPTIPEFRMRYVQILNALGRSQEADEQALALADVAPDHIMGRTARAHKLLRAGDNEAALSLLMSMVEDRSFDPTIHVQVVRILLSYPSVREEGFIRAQEWLTSSPEDHTLAGILGIETSLRGNIQAAMPLLTQGMNASPPEAGTAFHIARINLMLKKPDLALTAIDKEIAVNPSYPDAGTLRVEALARLERWDEVIADGAAYTSAPDVKRVTLHGVAQAYFNNERYAEARKLLDRALVMDPKNPELMTLDANLMVKEGKPREAAEARFKEAQALLNQEFQARIDGAEQEGRGVEVSPSSTVSDNLPATP
jgi:tetratricopeptide (TPR) repeat protein